MDAALKNDLEQLLSKYPSLLNSQVAFSENDISVNSLTSNSLNKSTESDIICKKHNEGPYLIAGHSSKVEVRRSPVHGYGVFAKEDIQAGELIEQSKLLKLGWRSHYNNDPVLKDYVWGNRKCKCDECKTHGVHQYLALGFGSLYNHSEAPNTKKKNDFAAEIITITAIEPIAKDQEIFVSYGHKYFIIRNFWKQVKANNSLNKFLEDQNKPETK
jgi:hypothetical protein